MLAVVPAVSAANGYGAMSVADIVRAAGVSRNAFYALFANKQECFAAAVEAGHERLFATLAEPCDPRAKLEERIEARLGAALDLLDSDPDLARMLIVEVPAAGRGQALRQHEWLRRYGELLRAAWASGAAERDGDEDGGFERIVVSGLATRLAAELLASDPPRIRLLTPNFVAFLMAVHGPAAETGAPAETARASAAPARRASSRRRAAG